VLRLFRAGNRVTPWIAVAIAYALVFQLLLSSFAIAQVQNAASDDIFVICYGGGDGAGDHGSPSQVPAHQTPCLLCTLAKGAVAILPLDHVAATRDVRLASAIVFPSQDAVVRHHSPTHRFPRGPPAA
jgi:hypothetical protein